MIHIYKRSARTILNKKADRNKHIPVLIIFVSINSNFIVSATVRSVHENAKESVNTVKLKKVIIGMQRIYVADKTEYFQECAI